MREAVPEEIEVTCVTSSVAIARASSSRTASAPCTGNRSRWPRPAPRVHHRAQPVAKRAKSVQPDMGHDLVTAGFNHHQNRAVSIHLASAVLAWSSHASTTPESLATRAPGRNGQPSAHKTTLNDRG